MKQLVQGYGIHRQDDLVFLHEQDGARCLTPGLAALESPFEVIKVPRQRCPHILPEPAAGQVLHSIRLVRVMMPTPKNRARLYWVDPSHTSLVFEIAQQMVDRPFDPAVCLWHAIFNPVRTLTPKLTLTNCIPLVVAGYKPRDFTELRRLCELPRTRSLVAVGYPRPPNSIDITPQEPIPDLDWRSVAAAHLHDFIKRVTCHV